MILQYVVDMGFMGITKRSTLEVGTNGGYSVNMLGDEDLKIATSEGKKVLNHFRDILSPGQKYMPEQSVAFELAGR